MQKQGKEHRDRRSQRAPMRRFPVTLFGVAILFSNMVYLPLGVKVQGNMSLNCDVELGTSGLVEPTKVAPVAKRGECGKKMCRGFGSDNIGSMKLTPRDGRNFISRFPSNPAWLCA
jgi:hypothetical protein